MLRFWIAEAAASPLVRSARASSGNSTTPTAEPITASGSW